MKEYTAEALDEFNCCLSDIQHYVKMELLKLRRFGPCTIRDINFQYHVKNWVREYDLDILNSSSTDVINALLANLGLPTIDEESYYCLRDDDNEKADDLYYDQLDNIVDFIQNGICDNWDELCEEIYAEEGDGTHQYISPKRSYLIPDKNFVRPKEYSPVVRKLLYDCFCYNYDAFVKYYIFWEPRIVDYLSRLVTMWLERLYCSLCDERSAMKIIYLFGEIFGVDVFTFDSPNNVYRLKKGCTNTFFSMRLFPNLTEHMANCILDLWDEFSAEYITDEFHKVSLKEFSPNKV